MNFTKNKISRTLMVTVLLTNLLAGIFNTDVASAAAIWEYVGAAGFSIGGTLGDHYTSLALGSDDTPYVAFRDDDNGSKATLMKYDGATWESVGTAGFSAGYAGYTSLALDSSDTPYVAYRDETNANKATLMKYNGTEWEAVGTAGFSAGGVSTTSLALDSNDTPYVAYRDEANGNKATLMTYNGTTWESVGDPGFSTVSATYTFVVLDSEDKPYVAFLDVDGQKATVMKHNGTNWEIVGEPGFSAGRAMYISMALDSQDTPYITYRDNGTGGRITVMKYSGANWENVGVAGFSSSTVGFPSIALDSDDVPYVAYQDCAYAYKTTLMKYNGTAWETIGSPGFSPGGASYQSLALDSSGIPYVAFRDASVSANASVMRYNAPNLQTAKVNDTGAAGTVGTTFNWTITISNSGEDSALFSAGATIVMDELPASANYGSPAIQNFANITNSGNIDCYITLRSGVYTLYCDANGGDVTIGAKSGAFDVTFGVTPLLPGLLTNPKSGGFCLADPEDILAEVNESNNHCNSDTVTVSGEAEMDILGNNISITAGDNTPNTADVTDFGSVDITTGSRSMTFTIKNTGILDLHLNGSPTVAGQTADFTITQPTSSSVVANGGTTTFTVTFDPSAVGLSSTTISIANDDSDENPYTFDIQGNGADGADAPVVIFGANTFPSQNAILATGITHLTLEFNMDVNGSANAQSANAITNYLLFSDGGDGAFDTVDCADGVSANDINVPVFSASYDDHDEIGPYIVTLNINNDMPLPAGNYRLLACGTTSIENNAGAELNGGADTALDFRVQGSSSGDAGSSEATSLPKTGYSPGVVLTLPHQPATALYSAIAITLVIPDLNLTMPIVGVPKIPTGWDVTWLGNSAGYLAGSAYPTWAGNTVLTGHVWDTYNHPGPFAQLKTLRYGNEIMLLVGEQTYTYEVRETRLISKNNVDAALQHEEYDWITLITCENYNPVMENYDSRRMVRAILVNVQ